MEEASASELMGRTNDQGAVKIAFDASVLALAELNQLSREGGPTS
jgi:hypothetical protein